MNATTDQVGKESRRVTSQRLMSAKTFGVNKPPKKSGPLQKYKPGMIGWWQDRTCEVDEGIFKYFKAQ